MTTKTITRRPWRELSIGFALFGASTITMITVFELASRARLGKKAPYSTRGMLRPDADVPYPLHEWTPGAKGVYRGLPLEINSSGFIGPEYSKDPAEGVKRIMVIGDSIAAGWGLESLSHSFANELEKRLVNSGMAVEVLNLAVPGYDAYESVLRLERIGIPFHPNLVVYVFCSNDILHAAGRPPPEATRAGNYDERHLLWHLTWWRFNYLKKVGAAAKHTPYPMVVGDNTVPLAEDPHLEKLHSQIDALADPGFFRDRADGYDARLGIGHFDYAMRRFASLAQQNRFRTLVVRVPYLSSRENEGRRLAEKIAAYILDKYQLPRLDLHEAYRSIGYRKLQHVDWDRIHPNARGHAEMARLVASKIEHGAQ